ALSPLGAIAEGINNAGQVCGSSAIIESGTLAQHAHTFRTAPNSAINPATDDLGVIGYNSGCSDINNLGQVAGGINNSFQHGFRTAPNSAINLATDDISPGVAGLFTRVSVGGLNDSGHVVGSI